MRKGRRWGVSMRGIVRKSERGRLVLTCAHTTARMWSKAKEASIHM